jgi:pimeloyl-ACP methyl ester carboxylesterase
VHPPISEVTRICFYDRAGRGRSDDAPIPRTSQDVAEDLHALLVNAQIDPPYVLVAHSLGGFHVRVFAGLYPEEVVGMVLVDASSPGQFAPLLAALPSQSEAEEKYWRAQVDAIKELRDFWSMFIGPDTDRVEGIDAVTSADQVWAAGSLGDLPLAVITRSPEGAFRDPDIPAEIDKNLHQIWQELQLVLTELSSNTIHLIAPDKVGHRIHIQEPELVIDGILWVLEHAAE